MGNEFSQCCDPAPAYDPDRGYKAFVATNKMNYREQANMPPAPGSRNPPGMQPGYSLGGQGGNFTSIASGPPNAAARPYSQPYSQPQPEPMRCAPPQGTYGAAKGVIFCLQIYVYHLVPTPHRRPLPRTHHVPYFSLPPSPLTRSLSSCPVRFLSFSSH